MYSKEELLDGLNTNIVGTKLFVFESIDSTNTCAKALAETGMDDGAVVFADFQSEGRGRLGRPWLSEPGKNLLFSCIIRPPMSNEQSGILTFFAAVAVAQALESVTKLKVECKWPNDLLLNGKKCCGILLENSLGKERLEYSVIGIGVNANQDGFQGNALTNATSLKQMLGMEVDRKKLFQQILREIDTHYADIRLGRISRIFLEWNNRCSMFGRDVTVAREGVTLNGKAVGLNTDGGLVLETKAGKEIIYAGDVTVIAV
jgi:BirA family biotin operon repressor/biotin-[acetyl-CoA-carboxylase] ligase